MQEASTSSAKLKLLNAALALLRERGYTDTTVDDLCRAAGVTKGTFFHYFSSKEALALAAIQHWNDLTGALFAGASYQAVSDPRERLFAYLDFRAQLVRGETWEFTCLLGTLVQETFATHPALRAACGDGIEIHARTLVPTIEAAKARYAPDAEWSAADLARHTQAVLQGAFVLAKALNNPQIVLDEIAHLRRYIEHLLPTSRKRRAIK
ncbi:MAG: TetR/AcrR family transcriptional regulator [Bryobacteraceae bacterium]|nr:TetR/AcrR family transcriptional regulator [Bryobacteraceae bacterium]MDW8379382.1 TetR/AcrR family transcriptional regulator [Bryobacterales bacterium]